MSSSGAISTTATLAAGLHTLSGTDLDTGGDSGTWSLTLSVGAVTLTQAAPTSASVPVSGSAAFTDQLALTHTNGALTYTVTTPAPGISVSSGGAISTTATLAAGVHTVSGTDADADGDSGTWSFPLTVTASTITQAAPTTGSVTNTASSSFTAHLAVSGANGTPVYTTTSAPHGVHVSSVGAVTTGSPLLPGVYSVSGTDTDPDLDTGTWSFALTVTAAPDTFTSATSTTGTVGQQLTFTVTTSATAKLKESGKLPKGVTFNKGAHLLAGIPTSTKHKTAAGTYFVTFTATFGKGKTKVIATQAFTLTVSS